MTVQLLPDPNTEDCRAVSSVLALGLVVFGTSVALAIRSGAWFRGQ